MQLGKKEGACAHGKLYSFLSLAPLLLATPGVAQQLHSANTAEGLAKQPVAAEVTRDEQEPAVFVRGDVIAGGNSRLRLETSRLPFAAVRIVSLPSGKVLLLALDQDFVPTPQGQALWAGAQKANVSAVITTELWQAAPLVQIPVRPSEDQRIGLWIWGPWPEEVEEERLVSDALVGQGAFAFSFSFAPDGSFRHCCEGSSCSRMCVPCKGRPLLAASVPAVKLPGAMGPVVNRQAREGTSSLNSTPLQAHEPR